MAENWEEIRKHRLSEERPDGWPEGVYAISTNGLALLGIHEKTDKLYWDGQEIVTKRVVRLRWYEVILATLATGAAVGVFVLDLGRALCWWGCAPTTG